jgi:hypothetical protein
MKKCICFISVIIFTCALPFGSLLAISGQGGSNEVDFYQINNEVSARISPCYEFENWTGSDTPGQQSFIGRPGETEESPCYSENGSEPDTNSIPYREESPLGLCFQLFGPTLLGVHLDYHLLNTLDIELGLGVGLDIQLGARYHLFGNGQLGIFSPYLGLFVSRIRCFHPGLFGSGMYWGPQNTLGVYIPVGMEIYAYKSLTFSAEGAYQYTGVDWGQRNTVKGLYFGVRLGFHLEQNRGEEYF